jgi:hypothetical protein
VNPVPPAPQSRAPERGIALLIAMFAIVVLGAIVGGTFFAGWLEQQSGENSWFATQAALGADAGLADGLATVSPASLSALVQDGPSLLLPPMVLANGVTVERQAFRSGGNLFVLSARATRLDAGGAPLASAAAGLLLHVLADSVSGAQMVVPLRDRAWVQLY